MLGWLFWRPPTVPERLTVEDVYYFLDGQTTVLVGTDEGGRERTVRLTQHMFPQRGGRNGVQAVTAGQALHLTGGAGRLSQGRNSPRSCGR